MLAIDFDLDGSGHIDCIEMPGEFMGKFEVDEIYQRTAVDYGGAHLILRDTGKQE